MVPRREWGEGTDLELRDDVPEPGHEEDLIRDAALQLPAGLGIIEFPQDVQCPLPKGGVPQLRVKIPAAGSQIERFCQLAMVQSGRNMESGRVPVRLQQEG